MNSSSLGFLNVSIVGRNRDSFSTAVAKNVIVVALGLIINYINGTLIHTFRKHQIFYINPRYNPLHPPGGERHDPADLHHQPVCLQLRLLQNQCVFMLLHHPLLCLHHTQHPDKPGRDGGGVLHRYLFTSEAR
ncbi:hypothetical protein KUCAC02_016845 [Chaenocephalus aceratus]|nr:hypothetical protein KUCAC02_016845 [Chaenocephalus aceratus]